MRRALFILLGVGVVASLLALVLAKSGGQGKRRVAFPGGIEVEYLGVTVGGQVFTTETRWQKFAKRCLPMRFHHWFPSVRSGSCSSSSNSVTVYLQLTDPTGAFNLGNLPWRGYASVDDNGVRYTRMGGHCTFGGGPANQHIVGLLLDSIPRRQAEFDLLLLADDQAIQPVVGQLRVPNPVRGPFPKWEPRPLPQSVTNGPVVLTLEGLQERGGESHRYASPKWKIESTRPEWAKAKPKEVTLHDATGNEAQWLSLKEPAWKLTTLLHRNRDEDFGADERLRIADLAIPETGKFVAIDRTAELSGVSVTVQVLAGAGRLFLTNGTTRAMQAPTPGEGGHGSSHYSSTRWVEYWGNSSPFFLVEARNIRSGDEVRFRLLDDQGYQVKLTDSDGSYTSISGGRMYKRGFKPPAGTKALALEVVLSRPLHFEFMVNPQDVQLREPKPSPR